MNEDRLKLRELQEISLWQQLNRQLLAMKQRGKPVKDASLKSLQSFCLDNHLFSTIKGSAVATDLPLSMVTDLGDTPIVTLNLKGWTRLLAELLPGSVVLDVERALASSFVALKKYHRQHGLTGAGQTEVEEDEALIDFADQYMDRKESVGLDLSYMIMALHEHKSAAVKKMIRVADPKPILVRDGDLLYLDFEKSGAGDSGRRHAERLQHIYREAFLSKTDLILRPQGAATWMVWETEIRHILESKLKESTVKESIRQFIAVELEKYNREIDMIDQYAREIKTPNTRKLAILNTTPFYFLSHPFPVL